MESILSPAQQCRHQKQVASSLGYAATRADGKADGFASMRLSRWQTSETTTLDFNILEPLLLSSGTFLGRY